MSEYRLRVTPEELVNAMQGEAEDKLFYERLMRMAPTREEADIIKQIRTDEIKHYEAFEDLYRRMTGRNPRVPETDKPTFRTYMEGVELAFFDELEAYEHYRDLYLSTQNPRIRDIFLDAFTDENEHAQYMHWIYSLHNRMHANNSYMQNMQMPAGQTMTGYTPKGQMGMGQMTTGQMPMGMMGADQLQPWQTGMGQMPAGQTMTGYTPMGQMGMGQIPMSMMGIDQMQLWQTGTGQMPAGQMGEGQMQAGNMMYYDQQMQDQGKGLIPDMETMMQQVSGMNTILQQMMPDNASAVPYQQIMDELPPSPLMSLLGREKGEKKSEKKPDK